MKTFIFKPVGSKLAIIVLHYTEEQALPKAREVAFNRMKDKGLDVKSPEDIQFGVVIELNAPDHCGSFWFD